MRQPVRLVARPPDRLLEVRSQPQLQPRQVLRGDSIYPSRAGRAAVPVCDGFSRGLRRARLLHLRDQDGGAFCGRTGDCRGRVCPLHLGRSQARWAQSCRARMRPALTCHASVAQPPPFVADRVSPDQPSHVAHLLQRNASVVSDGATGPRSSDRP